MKDLYLLNYNNYANRVVKKFATLEGYLPYLIGDVVQNINFNPNDGVTAQILINAKYAELGTPDYLIVTNVGSDEIESRWFVIESSRTRSGQYSLTLKRDTVAESILDVLSADSYILKGYVKPSNPLIYQSEGMRFNQIKQKEIPLMDGTGCPWIVGYISPDAGKEHGAIEGDIEGYYDSDYAKIEDYPYYKYSQEDYPDQDTCAVGCPVVTYAWFGATFERTLYLYLNKSRTGNQNLGKLTGVSCWTNQLGLDDETLENWSNAGQDVVDEISLIIPNITFHNKIEELREQNGRILKVGKELYRVELTEKVNQLLVDNIPVGSAADVVINNRFAKFNGPNEAYDGQRFLAGQLKIKGNTYRLNLVKLGAVEDKFTFQYNLANTTLSNDETPYGIICMPYSDKYNVHKPDGTAETNQLNAASRLKIMQALGSVANLLYDIQLLPYCPIRNLKYDSEYGIIETDNVRTIPVTAKTSNNYVTSMIVAQKSTFSFTIPYTITISDVKETNEMDMWRLNSPNYASSFEFNPAKFYEGDKQVIKFFDVDCTYKPYTPYIHIAPHFSGLYGKDFNDTRGLICSGDFSIDRISDNWETYQYNNKNFQLSFDRQIENMEVQHGWNMASNVVGGILGGVGAGFAGGKLFGPKGAVAGVGAGLFDMTYNLIEGQALHEEQKDFMRDQQQYQLGNIQAQPYALSKVSAINANNKIFPFLEYYTCTPEEKKIFKDHIKFNGMTVMSMGHILDYVAFKGRTFVKAQIVRINEDLMEDYHYVNDIKQELMTGVFIDAD